MRYLNNFDNYNALNEDKHSRAERKKEKAEGLVDDIQNAIEAGDTKKADRLIKKAAKRVDRAEELDPSVNTEDVANTLINLKSEMENPKDDFGLSSKEHRDKIKLTKFDIINKIKILGNEISNDELDAFLKSVINYLDEYWDALKHGHDFPKEYQSAHTNFELEVKRKFGRTVFLYKEGGADKIKLVFSNKDFSRDENKAEIIAELNDVSDSDNLKQELSSNYEETKDEIKFEPKQEIQNVEPNIPPAIVDKTEKIADVLTTKDDFFINQSVKLLIDEKLNVGFSNSDEEKIFEHFVTKNAVKTVVPENINEILIKYKKRKAVMNEAWYDNTDDFIDATVGSTQRGTQSMRTQESKGVVGDLMWAFNTDARTLSEDINEMLGKLSGAYQKELNKAIENLPKMDLVKEDVDTTSILTGMLASGYLLRNSPKLAKLLGIRGGAAMAGGGASAGAGSTVARGGLAGISRLGGLLANPYVWIGIAVVAAVAGGWYLWDTIDEQQNQLATIFLIMWASGSTEFHKELKQNGIVIKTPSIDLSKLNNLIKSGELFSQTEEVEHEEIASENVETFESKRIKSFKDFNK